MEAKLFHVARPEKLVRGEAALVETFLRLIPAALRIDNDRAIVRREVGVGRNIADVVIMQKSRLATRDFDTALSVTEAVVLSTLRRLGPMALRDLKKRCGVDLHVLNEDIVPILLQRRLLYRRYDGSLAARLSWHRHRVVAFEAKLTRWRAALSQASTYTRYANQSYVILPRAAAEVASYHRQAFAERGIGLISICNAEGLTVVFRSRASGDHDWQREFVCSRLMVKSGSKLGNAKSPE